MSRSYSSTCTEARVREVMKSVFDDIIALALQGFVTQAQANNWFDDLTYMLSKAAISKFELQLHRPGSTSVGFRYEVSDEGSLLEPNRSGGLKSYLLPAGTTGDLIVTWREMAPEVRAEVRRRGWTQPATSLAGESARERAYTSESYDLVRQRIGDW